MTVTKETAAMLAARKEYNQARRDRPAKTGPDTFPQWLYQRIGVSRWKSDDPSRGWDGLSEEDRAYWIHEAAAIRRAVARNGFKKAAAFDDGFGNEPPGPIVGFIVDPSKL